jgi:hypothetical protein
MKTSEILFKAREIQLKRGRANGYLELYPGGPTCMLGSISAAVSGYALDLACIPAKVLSAVLYVTEEPGFFPPIVGAVARFSNHHYETVEDMAAALEIAACCAAAEGD